LILIHHSRTGKTSRTQIIGKPVTRQLPNRSLECGHSWRLLRMRFGLSHCAQRLLLGGNEFIITFLEKEACDYSMSKSSESNQPGQPAPSKSGNSISKPVGIALIIITVLAIAAAGYAVLNPQVTTVTQQQLITNTQSISIVQTLTANNRVTIMTTVTTTSQSGAYTSPPNSQVCGYYGCNYPGTGYSQNCGMNSCAFPTCNSGGCTFQLCGPNGCSAAIQGYYQLCGQTTCSPQECGYNGCYYTTCQSTGQGTVQCAGYLYQNSNGCTEIAVPVANWVYGAGPTTATQYYTLQGLPSSYPSVGSWVTVTGQLKQGSNTSSTGAGCPGNYINVNSIS
jgi:hypothetical protein